MNDFSDEACGLELKPGLNGVRYEQKFVRAPNQGKYPCNYAAEKVPESEAMKMAMGK